MKRLSLVFVVALCMCTTVFAEKGTETENLSVDASKLSKCLNLSSQQAENVTNICEYFNERMQVVNNSSKKRKKDVLHNTIYGNLKLMKGELTKEQYSKYLELMNLTLKNRGIEL